MDSTPKLISDVPSTEDFLGGVHKRVADAIARLIRTCDGGKTIRLDGTWGSGKSTVVYLLAKDLEEGGATASAPENADKETFAVFQYDTWVHTGDPLRRAFMTALVNRLDSSGWLPGKGAQKDLSYWKTQLQRLDRRLKLTSKKTESVFSPIAKVVVAALLGIAVVSPSLGDLVKQYAAKLGLGVAITLGLSVAVLAFLVLHLLADKIFATIVQRSPDEVTTESKEDPDPTTLEFQNVFGELMDTVLSRPPDAAGQTPAARNLVLVVDNLDRIGDAETREVWSLLRSFLDNPAFSTTPWFKRLWVLVPIADATQAIPDTANPSDEKQSAERGRSTFMEKVFQVRFSLPNPMLHSWKGFLARTLEQAFKDIEADQIDVIGRLFEEFEERDPSKGARNKDRAPTSITPRGVISFVNDLVALKIEHGENAELPVLAGFVLTREHGDSGHTPPEWMNKHLNVDRLDDHFAMLYYHAKDIDEASYILIKPMLASAILAADSQRLGALLEQSPGAPFILDRFIRKEFITAAPSADAILLKARALAPILLAPDAASILDRPNTGKPGPQTIAAAKQAFFEELSAIDTLNLFNDDLLLGLASLTALLREHQTLDQTLLGILGRSVARTSSGLGARENIHGGWQRWSSSLRATLAFIADPAHAPANFSMPMFPDVRDRLAADLVDKKESWLLDAYTEAKDENEQDFVSWFTGYLPRTDPSEADAMTLRFALSHDQPNTGNAVIAAVCEEVKDGAKYGHARPDQVLYDHALELITLLTREVRSDARMIDLYWPALLQNIKGLVGYGAVPYHLWLGAQTHGVDARSGKWAVLAIAGLLNDAEPASGFAAEPNAPLKIDRVHAVLFARQSAHISLARSTDPAPTLDLLKSVLTGESPISDEDAKECARFVASLHLCEVFAPMAAHWGEQGLVAQLVRALPHTIAYIAIIAGLKNEAPTRDAEETFCERYLPTRGLRRLLLDARRADPT